MTRIGVLPAREMALWPRRWRLEFTCSVYTEVSESRPSSHHLQHDSGKLSPMSQRVSLFGDDCGALADGDERWNDDGSG